MNIKSEKNYTIFRDDVSEKTYYKINLFKKDKKENKIIYGTINCRFRKGVELENNQKIVIDNAWIDFYINQKNITVPYIFIDEFKIVK